MVDNVFFILQTIGILVLLYWALTRDRKGDDAAHGGLLAMRRPDAEGDGQTASPRHKQRPTRRRTTGSRAGS